MRLRAALASLLLLALSACSGGRTPTDVTTEFLAALHTDDLPRASRFVTEASRAMLESGDLAFSSESVEAFALGEETIDGDRAQVELTVTQNGEEQEAALLLRRESDEWLVHGLRVSFGGSFLTLDFEETSNPLESVANELAQDLGEAIAGEMQAAFDEWEEDMARGGSLEDIAAARERFRSVTSTSADDHERAWRTDLALDGVPARAAVERLLGDAWTLESHDALETAVTLEAEGLSRIEAVARVAESVGLHPVWPTTETWQPDTTLTLGFAEGESAIPTVYAGPFQVQLTELTENAPNTTGSLTYGVRALGLAPSVLAYQTEMVELVPIAHLRGPNGERLTDEDVHHMGTPEVRGDYLSYSITKDLEGLLRAVTELETAGSVRLDLPGEVETVSWPHDRTAPMETSLGTLSLSSWENSVRFRLESEDDLEGVTARLSPLRADGSPLGVHWSSSSGWGQQLDANVDCPEEPATIEVKLCRSETAEYPFAFEGIPLTRHAEQPEELEPLSFDGPSPVALEYGGAVRENGNVEVTVRAANRSNKDATQLTVVFHYLDAAGNELEDFPHMLTGEWDFDLGGPAPAVASRTTADLVTFAAFAPEDFANIRLELSRVEFPDGTVWPVEAN